MKWLKKHLYWFLIPAVAIVLFDEWAKSFGLKYFPDESTLNGVSIFNLAIHKNWGMAFDIPFRRELILLISVVIGYFLVDMVVKNIFTNTKIAFSCFLILIGAAGNVFDRLAYGFTVDYMILFGRSAFNLSDILIVLGVVLLLVSSRRSRVQQILDKTHLSA